MDDALAQQIGHATREARLSLGHTQADVAEKLGISKEFYGRIERGKTLPATPTLYRLAVALGISADALLGLKTASAEFLERSTPVREATDPPELRRLVRRLRHEDVTIVRALLAMTGVLHDVTSASKAKRKPVRLAPPRAARMRKS